MSAQRPERCGLGVDLKWDVICIQPVRCQHDQSTEWVGAHQVMQDLDAGFGKMSRNVHGYTGGGPDSEGKVIT